MDIRKISFFYTKLYKHQSVDISSDVNDVVKVLTFEKICTINENNKVILNDFCTEEDYLKQKEKNERRYKTIISHIQLDTDGRRRIVHRLFRPFHEHKAKAKQNYSLLYGFKPDETNWLEVQHVDSMTKEIITL